MVTSFITGLNLPPWSSSGQYDEFYSRIGVVAASDRAEVVSKNAQILEH